VVTTQSVAPDDVALVTTNEAVNMQVYPQSPPGVNIASITEKQLFQEPISPLILTEKAY
jgi:hypothetical protein